jgi:hypothetical protein
MTPETDETGSDDAQRAPAPAARGRKDTLWAGLATTVAIASMLWIAYQSNVRNEVTLVQRQIEAQHAELQSLKGQNPENSDNSKSNRCRTIPAFGERNSGTSESRRYSSWAAKTAKKIRLGHALVS